jgi:AAA domain
MEEGRVTETPYSFYSEAVTMKPTTAVNGYHERDLIPLRRADGMGGIKTDELVGSTSTRLKIRSAADLQNQEFPEIRYIVPDIIAPGLTLFSGKPKIGKSWFCLDMALSVAGDRYCLGDLKCDHGDVLFIGLEDNERRLQRRIAKLLPSNVEWPRHFHYATEWPRANDGGLNAIKDWCRSAPMAKLIVVDVLAAFRGERRPSQSQYEADYAAIKDLQQIASDYVIAIMVVHHNRKAGADVDRFDLVSGTNGLSGAADTALILDRDAIGFRLYGRGRDVEEIDKAIEFNKETCRWKLLGEAAEVRRSDERTAILDLLYEADEPMQSGEIGSLLGQPVNNIRQLLHKMGKEGQVIKLPSRGGYIHPERDKFSTTDNDDNAITPPGRMAENREKCF